MLHVSGLQLAAGAVPGAVGADLVSRADPASSTEIALGAVLTAVAGPFLLGRAAQGPAQIAQDYILLALGGGYATARLAGQSKSVSALVGSGAAVAAYLCLARKSFAGAHRIVRHGMPHGTGEYRVASRQTRRDHHGQI